MKREYKSEAETSAVLKEALYLAWKAAGGPQGRGFLQDKGEVDKERVWDQAYNEKDYSGVRHGQGIDLHADYVFGRMLKLNIGRPSPTTLDVPDWEPQRDYQSWCGQFGSYASLFDAAEKIVGVTASKQAA